MQGQHGSVSHIWVRSKVQEQTGLEQAGHAMLDPSRLLLPCPVIPLAFGIPLLCLFPASLSFSCLSSVLTVGYAETLSLTLKEVSDFQRGLGQPGRS